jgi:glycosyltransferase involved in cell wall biosynthesis
MANRAFKYADAVVVPTHALAAELGTILPFGDRVRVLGGAVSPALRDPDDGDERASRLDLPADYLLTVGDLGFGLDSLLSALATLKRVSLPLVVSGDGVDPAALAEAAARASLDPDRIVAKPMLDDADRAVVLRRAKAFIFPTTQSGFGTPMLEAFRFELPVIHSDAPGLVEVAGDAGFAVPSSDQETYPGLLAEAIENVLDDETLSRRLGILGSDREKLFTWRTPAEGVWQLQADL